MSLAKLNKHLARPDTPLGNNRIYTPAILSDSKGLYIKEKIFSNHPVNQHIEWWCKRGATTEQQYKWLKDNIRDKIETLGSIWLYVWLGTCNLTQKDGKYINIRSYDNSSVETVETNLQNIIDTVAQYPSCKLTILEIPTYSIVQWNKKHHHKNPDNFKDQDNLLDQQVYTLNNYIRQLITTLRTHSPIFTIDLQSHRKVKSGKHPENRKYYNFNLYTDGIHPGHTLARYWLRKISDQVKLDCWN